MIIKKTLQRMKPYNPKFIDARIRLDANEQSFALNIMIDNTMISSLNRYPIHQNDVLIDKISKAFSIDSNGFILGSGSSELLELIIKTYIEPSDVVLSLEPTFVMYEHYTRIQMGQFETVLESDDVLKSLLDAYHRLNPKLIIISNPNNPTGRYIEKEKLLSFISKVACLVVVDEAYIEFVDYKKSLAYDVLTYPNLIVTRSFSKAFGLASARLGYLITTPSIKETLLIAKTPYSISTFSQILGMKALENMDEILLKIEDIKKTRDMFSIGLSSLGIKHIKSYGNFIYVYEKNKDLYQTLLAHNILIRTYNNGYFRITIGTLDEMNEVLNILKEIYHV